MAVSTKISVLKLSSELKKKRVELQEKRKLELEKYKQDFAAWKKSLADWLDKNGRERITGLTSKDIENYSGSYRSHDIGFPSDYIFFGSPRPPKRPSDKQIRDITAFLRQLSITGQSTVTLDTNDIAKYLTDGRE